MGPYFTDYNALLKDASHTDAGGPVYLGMDADLTDLFEKRWSMSSWHEDDKHTFEHNFDKAQDQLENNVKPLVEKMQLSPGEYQYGFMERTWPSNLVNAERDAAKSFLYRLMPRHPLFHRSVQIVHLRYLLDV